MRRQPPRPDRRTSRRREIAAALLSTFVWISVARGQTGRFDVAISSSPSPVGAGARATGVGSAFIALADDATAASWNPAGLVQLERPEVSAVGLGVYQTDHVPRARSTDPDVIRDYEVDASESGAVSLDYLSIAIPFAWSGRNTVVSINYQQMLSFERAFDLTYELRYPGDRSLAQGHFDQGGSINAVSPSAAIDLVQGVSVGLALNFWLDGIGRSVAWESVLDVVNTDSPSGATESHRSVFRTRNDLFEGTNATFGLLWRASDSVRVGAMGKLPFHASFRSVTDALYDGDLTGTRRARLRMELPASVGAGVAWLPGERLALSLDVTHVRWDAFRLSDQQGNEYLISGDPVSPSNPLYPEGGPPDGYHVDPVTTVRAGAEYSFDLDPSVLALRGGAFYDPEPSRGVPETAFGGALGVGWTWKHASIDLAYQLRAVREADGIAVLQNVLAQQHNSIDSLQHRVYASVIAYY